MKSLFRASLPLVFFAFSGFALATPISCFDLVASDLAKKVRRDLGIVSADRTSFTELNLSLVSSKDAEFIFQKALRQFGGPEALAQTHFFTQLSIASDGRLKEIVDPTVKKESGVELAESWSSDPQTREVFRRIFNAVKSLENEMRHSLPETEVELAELVFTLQFNKASENWHLDWYPQEYIIATQTFLAKNPLRDSKLENEPVAGTEYLLIGDSPQVAKVLSSSGKVTHIEFMVNAEPAQSLVGNGFHYLSHTGALTIHSGTTRVHQILGLPLEALGYVLISPPHRGSYKGLVLRGALAVRFKPVKREL